MVSNLDCKPFSWISRGLKCKRVVVKIMVPF